MGFGGAALHSAGEVVRSAVGGIKCVVEKMRSAVGGRKNAVLRKMRKLCGYCLRLRNQKITPPLHSGLERLPRQKYVAYEYLCRGVGAGNR